MVARVYNDAEDPLVAALLDWYAIDGRDLPWHHTTPWGVLVSEFMLQQTPVDRVLPVWEEWLRRWPTPTELADAPVAEAIRAWGRLGYPRRAQRLHATATIIRERFDGLVPADTTSLRSLPGVGGYTAAAVQAFAFGRHSIVLDTNIRRVIARTRDGRSHPPAHLSVAETATAAALWPGGDERSARWSAAVMQFGARVCTARNPACDGCPVVDQCRWRLRGFPVDTERPRRRQPSYEGSDRQARGAILQVLRDRGTATSSDISTTWNDAAQHGRALTSLVADGLIVETPDGYSLP